MSRYWSITSRTARRPPGRCQRTIWFKPAGHGRVYRPPLALGDALGNAAAQQLLVIPTSAPLTAFGPAVPV